MVKKYTKDQKIAYYKKKASIVPRVPRNMVSGYGAYSLKRNYQKPYKYPGAGKKYGSAIGQAVGNLIPAVGGNVGSMVGGALGRGAHSLVKTITGFGDYSVSENALVFNRDAVPEFSNSSARCTTVMHREFITDVYSSTGFVVNDYRINPAIASSFPWLAQIAENYEQYVVQGMVFEFKTTSATAVSSTNTSLGTVIMATQYNSHEKPFVNKQQMENYEFSQSSVPCQSILHAIECDPTQTQCSGIFNTFDPSATAGDIRLYDIGRFSIATVGMQQADCVIGELWVSYKICLLKPRLNQGVGEYDFYVLDKASVASASPLGTTSLAVANPRNTNAIFLSGVNRINFRSEYIGVFQITISWQWNGANPHYLFPPALGFLSSKLTDRTATYCGSNGSVVDVRNPSPNDASAVMGNTQQATFFIETAGGKEAGGLDPYLNLTNITQSGITYTYVTLLSVSVNFQF